MATLPMVGYALLALLARDEATGQQLTRRLQDPLGYFWTAPHSQVYVQLRDLTTSGLVEHEATSRGHVRPRKRYRLTAAGRRELRAWLGRPLAPHAVRDELVLRAYAAPVADPAELASVVAGEAARLRAELADYERFGDEIRQQSPEAPHDPAARGFGNWAALQAGIAASRARLAWCEWMEGVLTGGER